ncbi:MAG: bifunctional glutamate N-acetyltransferase/amino-acid acetyltransferase ArgJ [Gemmatimonas sp.]
MTHAVSPLAPERFPDLPQIAGVRLHTAACGIRYQGRTDLMVAELAPGSQIAGVFTRSAAAAAPVLWDQQCAKAGRARGLVVNAGNANAFTGKIGMASVKRTAAAAAKVLGCKATEVFVSSTGVIGVPLPDEKITAVLPDTFGGAEVDWETAARAIMTTDTFPKGSARTARIGKATVNIAGIIKGSGMIAPNMGTMLGYVFTDAKLPAAVLRSLLRPAADRTFNAITVDSDTSTSDTVLLVATGKGPEHPPVRSATDAKLKDFRQKLEEVLRDLAHQVIRDGEGATKFVSIAVTGARSDDSARRIGLAVANSPLVKTAIAGSDANWGRIVAAVGKSGEPCDMDRLKIAIGGVPITQAGAVRPDYDEMPVAEHMKGQNIDIVIDAGARGRGRATVWTCDMTHRYIDINIGYRS